jgi:hypothetical protein
LVPFLWAGDPLGDDAVEELAKRPYRESWDLVTKIATRGLASEPDAPPALAAYFRALEAVPAWVDEATLNRGGHLVLRTGILSGLVLAARSIVLGYASPGGNKPLIFAGGLVERASKRLNETARYVRAVVLPDGLLRGRDGYVATAKVRLMHAHVRRSLSRDARWRASDWGTPINQHDMAATTLLFSYAVIDGLTKLGVSIDDEQRESYMHLWRYAGHLMGVSQDLLPASFADGVRLADLIAATQGPPDDDARALTRAMLEAGLLEARNVSERRKAERGVHLARAAAPLMLGEDFARQLGFEPTPVEWAMPLLRRIVKSTEWLNRARPFGEAQLRAGTRYWDEILERGYAIYGVPFHLPQVSGAPRDAS